MPTSSNAKQEFSRRLHEIEARAIQSDLTLGTLLDLVGPKGTDFFCILLVLPFLQPIPLPGLSIPLGLAVAILSFLQLVGKSPRLPYRLERVTLPKRSILAICSVAVRLLKKLEEGSGRLVWGKLFRNSQVRWSLNLIVFVHALILALPLPIPATNFAPSVVIFFTCLALLEENYLIFILAAFALVLDAVFFILLILLAMKGAEFRPNWLHF